LWRRNSWSLGIIFILCLSFCLAQSINLTYPDNVDVNEEFVISLSLVDFDPVNYDVKIEILGAGQRIAQIYDGKDWKSCYYYVNGALEKNEEFEMRINKEFEGEANLIIKLRNGNQIESFEGYTLEVNTPPPETQEESDETYYETNDEAEEIDKQSNEDQNSEEQKTITSNIIKTVTPNEKKKEIIQLNGKNNKEIILYRSENEVIKSFLISSFLIFTIVLIAFLVIKKKRNKKFEEI